METDPPKPGAKKSVIFFDPNYGVTYYTGEAAALVVDTVRANLGFVQTALAGVAKVSGKQVPGNQFVYTFIVQKVDPKILPTNATTDTY